MFLSRIQLLWQTVTEGLLAPFQQGRFWCSFCFSLTFAFEYPRSKKLSNLFCSILTRTTVHNSNRKWRVALVLRPCGLQAALVCSWRVAGQRGEWGTNSYQSWMFGISAPLLLGSEHQKDSKQRALWNEATLEPLSGRLPCRTDGVCVCVLRNLLCEMKETERGEKERRGLM